MNSTVGCGSPSKLGQSDPARENSLDFLMVIRVFACLMVILIHSWDFTPADVMRDIQPRMDFLQLFGHPAGWLLRSSGSFGVYIFFALSGYLMGKGFITGRFSCMPGSAAKFIGKRAVRIIPLFWVVFGVYYLGDWQSLAPLLPQILTLTYYDGSLNHLWSVSTEFQFYLLVPLFAYCMYGRAWSNRVIVGAWMAGFVFSCLYVLSLQTVFRDDSNSRWWWSMVYTPLSTNLLVFLTGMAANLFTIRARPQLVKPRVLGLIFLGLYLAGSYCADGGPFFLHGKGALHLLWDIPQPFVVALAASYAIFLADRGNPQRIPLSLRAIQGNPWRLIEVLGVLTYGMYVWHPLICHALTPHITAGTPLRFILCFALLVGLSVIAAMVSYVLVEKPATYLWERAVALVERRYKTPVPIT